MSNIEFLRSALGIRSPSKEHPALQIGKALAEGCEAGFREAAAKRMTKYQIDQCPFCGGNGKLISTVTSGMPWEPLAYCTCEKCGATAESFVDIGNDGRHIIKAINAWNGRAGHDRNAAEDS